MTILPERPTRSDMIIYQTEDGKPRSQVRREGELQENTVVKDFLRTAADGNRYLTNYFNLDTRGTAFH